MATFTETVEIDVSPNDFEDDELIAELEARGYVVEKEPEVIQVVEAWDRGNKKEALVLLERQFPELYGLSRLAD